MTLRTVPKSKVRKCQASGKKKKLKKSKDKSRCCGSCNFCDKRKKDEPICAISGESVQLDGVCPKINTEIRKRCQCCGKEVKYKTQEDYYHNCFLFEMKTEGGDSSGQRIHLCRECREQAYEIFENLLEHFKGRHPEKQNIKQQGDKT